MSKGVFVVDIHAFVRIARIRERGSESSDVFV